MGSKRPVLAAAILGLLAAVPAAALAADEGEGMEGGKMEGAPPAAAPAEGAAAKPAADPAEDVLVLKDGKEIRGRITDEDDASYAVKVGGALRFVEKSKVAEVRRGAPAPAKDGAGEDAPPAPGAGAKKPAKEVRRERREAKGEGEGAMQGPPPPLTADARAWAGFCIDRLMTEDPQVRRSAAEALRALGPPVLPLLEEAAAKADERGRKTLERVASLVKNPPGPPPGPGGRAGGKGPGGPPGERGMALLDRVRKDLALDDDAARVVGGRLLEFGRDLRETLQDARDGIITYEDARAKVAGMRTGLRESLKASLGEEQLAKLDAILDEQFKAPGRKPPAK